MVCVCLALQNNCVFLSINVPTNNGRLCPEETEFVCRTSNLASTSLRWSHDNDIIFEPLTYLHQSSNEFPFFVDTTEVLSEGILNLTITDAAIAGSGVVNFTAVLLVDMQVLFGNGYRSLQCGSLTSRDNFTFAQLDIEGM